MKSFTKREIVPRASFAILWACRSRLAGTVHRDGRDVCWPTRHRAPRHPIDGHRYTPQDAQSHPRTHVARDDTDRRMHTAAAAVVN